MSYHPGPDIHHVRGFEHLKNWEKSRLRRGVNAATMSTLGISTKNLASDTQPLSETPQGKPLSEYRRLAALTRSPDEMAVARNDCPIYDGATPKTQPAMNTITKKYPPHQAHKHHYGWSPPVPEYAVGGFEHNTTTYTRHGDAMKYANDIHPKAVMINTKR